MGYDPYDALNSSIIRRLPSKFLKLAFTQFFVYSPVNLRPFFGVKKGVNPKALGLVMRACCNLFKMGYLDGNALNEKLRILDSMLEEKRSMGYSGHCWGFNFPWQDLTRFSKSYLPTVVNTSTISNGYLDAYEITGDERYLKKAESACKFIIKDLNRYENDYGICLSYTPIDRNVVHNASLLGAEVLFRVGEEICNDEYKDLAKNLVDFSLAYQRNDGSWPYSLNPSKGIERMQIDFHQGFVIDSLITMRKLKNMDMAIKKGADFYFRNQFEDGLTLWRYPKKRPRDIHHQAQGLITSSRMYLEFGDRKYKKIN